MNTIFFLLAILFAAIFSVLQVMRDENIPHLTSWRTVAKVFGWVVLCFTIALTATRLSTLEITCFAN